MKSIGSTWRIWDLHVHSPATYGGEYSTFISNASQSKADVIGINDYCSIKGYEEIVKLGGVPGKTIFPVVELRMNNLLTTKRNPNGVKINFHIIFDNDKSVLSKITTWLASQKCFDEQGKSVQLGTGPDLLKVSFDFEKVVESLKEFDLYDSHSLIWLPYDEYGGIDEINPLTDGYFKLALINRSHIIGSSTQKQIEFFKWQDKKFSEEQYKSWFEQPKPCIKGSDAHEINYPFGHLRNQNSEPIDRHCWIRSDQTFGGLKQILTEPDRVFIGEQPDLLKRVKNNPTKFIKSISVKKIEGAIVEDVWFDDFIVEFNSGLVAIIGNKGSGKSAITDILGLCGNTHQDLDNFSFLNKNKFRKQKPINLSEKFVAELTWADGTTSSKVLNQNPDLNSPERVKYIPQNFLELLCADVESSEFEEELKQIIYAHTPEDKRLGKASLDELIKYKSDLVNGEIASLQTEISKLNRQIIDLEGKTTEGYKKSVENNLELKRTELVAHNAIQPPKPASENESEESKKLVANLTTLREQIKTLEDDIAAQKKKKSALSIKEAELNKVSQYYRNLDTQLKKYQEPNSEYAQILARNGIKQEDIFSYKIEVSKISSLLSEVEKEIKGIDETLDPEKKESKSAKLQVLLVELKHGQEELDKPAKEQQKYLDDLKGWENKKKEIEGSSDTEGSLKYYETQLAYLNERLHGELGERVRDRKIMLGDLYDHKISLLEIRRELFDPIAQFIGKFKELKQKYDVNIDVALEFRLFHTNFFHHVAQNRTGTYYGNEEGYKKLSEFVEKTHFSTKEDFIQFADELIDSLKHNKRVPGDPPIDINTQLRKGISLNQLYDYIYNGEYLQPAYNLKLGDKILQELSPGERGALLLIFYLLLDTDDKPLLIDQPEENLDNESVYNILVHFIKMVKEHRQIIIVTHNPNLAIVCDADQIINMQIEKKNKNTVKYTSGAIENDIMNKAVVNVLEGTLPAFNNRDSKYFRN